MSLTCTRLECIAHFYNPVANDRPEINQEVMGGTMRLGSRPTSIVLDLPGDGDERSLASEIYGFAGVTAAKGAGGTSGEEREQTVAGRVSER